MMLSTRSNGIELSLIPVGGPHLDARTQTAGSGDSEFDVNGLELVRGQWVNLRIRMEVGRGEWSAPSLHFELNADKPEVHIVGLPSPTPDQPDIELIVNVPPNFRSVRLRPNARPGRFRLGAATALVIGRARATFEMLRAIAAVDGLNRAATMLLDAAAPARSASGRHEARQRIVHRYMEVRLRQNTLCRMDTGF